jgi:hypothetical protein
MFTARQTMLFGLKNGPRITTNSFVLVVLALSSVIAASAQVTIDAIAPVDQGTKKTSVSTGRFSTSSANELLLAFISADSISSTNVAVNSVSGAGLTWVRVIRTNAQRGTAEIWRTFASSALTNVTVTASLSQNVSSSMTVMTFSGVDTTGTNGSGAVGTTGTGNAPAGAPTATLITTRNNSLVVGAGNDWDNAILRTPGSNQTIVHQFLAPVGDTYWVQRQNSATPLSGTSVTINDIVPTGDRYNLSICEILPAGNSGTPTYSISGTVSPVSVGSGATLTLTGPMAGSTTADQSGNYSFSNLPNGTYTVTPSKTGQTFTPASQTINVNGAPVPGVNFAAVTYALSGTVSPTSVGSTTTVTLSGPVSGTTTPDSNGNYAFTLPNGTYTVTPSQIGYTFSPPNSTVTINGAPVGAVNFSATVVTGNLSISGSISPTSSGIGTLMTLSGPVGGTATADANANYSFSGLNAGTYTITPSKNGFSFTPGSRTVTISSTSATGVNFTAAAVPSSSISGTISPAPAGAGSVVTLSPYGYAVADSNGNFSFSNLPANTYTLTVARTGFTFSPPQLTVVLNGTASTGNNFSGSALPPSTLNSPDLSDIIPPAAMSIVGTGSSRVFQYTHDTFEGGSGPLEIQPVYNSASGNYQGIQHIYSLTNGSLTVAQSIPVAGAFVFDPAHLHFHFPFVTYGLYNSNPDGSIGPLVVPSMKDGFCIDNSFIYDSLLPNAGFGTWGTCGDPTTLRGLSIGAVDEYDQTDPGQAITIGTLPDGIYWLRAQVDPNNFLAESDKSNNETDVQMQFTGNTVTVLRIFKPALPPPPSVTLTSPIGSTVSGTVQLAATTASSGGSGMQFLLDGLPFGSVVSSAPYALNWDTTTSANGTHWLAAQYTDSTGRIGTSPVATVNVGNSGSSVPVVTVTDPVAGSTVSAVVIMAANVASANPVSSVQFYVDGTAVGSPVTAPPYSTFWDTETYSAGTHSITAAATDSFGGIGTSSPVSVTVDNSHPANLIGIDKQVFVDGVGTMTTPAFSTSADNELLIAFVALDGPSSSSQTATVSGSGLTWTLLKRSNTQAGDAEIWATVAPAPLTNATVIVQPAVGTGYHGTLVAVAFTNAAGPGIVNQSAAPSGAPDIYIPGVSAGNWVFAVGNDWDNAIARTPVSGQYLVHQRVDTSVGDTYWVQATTTPSTATALVDIHDSAPTTDRWNYCAVEIVATRQ